MAKRIKWSPRAADSFEEICNYIARDSGYYASVFAKRIVSLVKAIPDFPKSGRIVPEYQNENIREKIYQNYRIVYRIKKEVIEIAVISHGSKLLNDIE